MIPSKISQGLPATHLALSKGLHIIHLHKTIITSHRVNYIVNLEKVRCRTTTTTFHEHLRTKCPSVDTTPP